MIIGAKILLAADSDAACEGLARLAGDSWLLSMAQHEVRGGHPAGSARPGAQVPRQRGLIAVEFGELAPPDGACAVLPVRWESLEAGDSFTVLLDADMTVAPVTGQSYGVLTLAGVCRLAGSLNVGTHEQNRALVTAAARTFITSVADAVTRDAVTRGAVTRGRTSGLPQPTASPALSWLSELPGTLPDPCLVRCLRGAVRPGLRPGLCQPPWWRSAASTVRWPPCL